MIKLKRPSFVWHPNTQMKEWDEFSTIKSARGMWLVDSKGNKMLDGVASMWCNVWGHSDSRLVGAMARQAKKLQHSSLFNITNEPAEKLAESLAGMSPGMHRVFFSDNGSSAMEIALKMALQYWRNKGGSKRARVATIKNGYHGDTFGAMSVGYVPEFFGQFRTKLFPVTRFPAPETYRLPRGCTASDHTEMCLERIERGLAGGDVAAFVMESGAQVAGGVNIYPKGFQRRVRQTCKKHGTLLVLDEIATGLGRLGSMVEYEAQKSTPDIVAYGKMLTGGYVTAAATLASKKIYDSFLGEFGDKRHLFHGHTYTGNPIAAAVANENLRLYRARNLIRKIQSTSRVFEGFYGELSGMEIVGDVRHRGMLMGIELVKDRGRKTRVCPGTSANRIVFEEGRRQGVYLRTLGNIVMLVPPLAITRNELCMLLERTVRTIKNAAPRLVRA